MIEIAQTLSESDYRSAAAIHYKTYRFTAFRPWLAGLLICLGLFLFSESTEKTFGIFSIVFGIFMLVRKKLWIDRVVKSLATAKQFGEIIRVAVDSNGSITSEQGEDHSEMQIKNLFGFVRHPIGFLLYPQRSMFYYLKAEAFESEEQMDILHELLRKFEIKELRA